MYLASELELSVDGRNLFCMKEKKEKTEPFSLYNLLKKKQKNQMQINAKIKLTSFWAVWFGVGLVFMCLFFFPLYLVPLGQSDTFDWLICASMLRAINIHQPQPKSRGKKNPIVVKHNLHKLLTSASVFQVHFNSLFSLGCEQQKVHIHGEMFLPCALNSSSNAKVIHVYKKRQKKTLG